MEQELRTEFRNTEAEAARYVQKIVALENAIKNAKIIKYDGEERRKSPRATRREDIARHLVTLHAALSTLETTGSLDDAAKLMIADFHANCILTSHAYYDAKGAVVIPEWYSAETRAWSHQPSAAPTVEPDIEEL